MASFYGKEIIFDSKSSLEFDLRISSFETGGTSQGSAGSESQLVEKRIYRKTTSYYYGRLLHTPLEFKITLMNFDSKFVAIDRSSVFKWLLGRSGYKELMIVQDDMESIIFNAFIISANIEYVGNIARGVTINVKCKEPWGFEGQKTLVKTYGGTSMNDTFSFYNNSDEDDYLYPIISFTNNSSPNSFSITNNTEGRTMSFTGLTGALVVFNVDCDKQIISNVNGDRLIDKFNKTFFRLLPGNNSITIVGNIAAFTMSYRFARKIGG